MTPSTRTSLRRGNGTLSKVVEPIPVIGTTDVLICVKAVALNWKDAAILNTKFPWPSTLPSGIHGSEFSGEVVEVGGRVTSFQAGDRVISMHDQLALTGRETMHEGLGQQVDGTLTDYLVLPAHTLIKVPSHFSWEEASSIAVAGITAWNALDSHNFAAGKTVLLQGTGGVSLVALQLAQKLGFRIIITSSSDAKLEKAKKLGASLTINYKDHPQWENEVRHLTKDVGVDLVVDQGGAATLLQSVSALKKGGRVSQVGLLTSESRGSFVPLIQMLIMKVCTIQGIQVGTKSDLLAFCNFLEATKLSFSPLIDRVFDFEDTIKALEYLTSGDVFGKVVIRLY